MLSCLRGASHPHDLESISVLGGLTRYTSTWPVTYTSNSSGNQRVARTRGEFKLMHRCNRILEVLNVPCRHPSLPYRGMQDEMTSEADLDQRYVLTSTTYRTFPITSAVYEEDSSLLLAKQSPRRTSISNCLIRFRRQGDRHANSQLPLNQCAQLLYQQYFDIGENNSRHDCLGKRYSR
jgi:hypothetical protein